VQMSSFIYPELRHTKTEFYTLNPHEVYALRSWKKLIENMQRNDVPSNKEFCNQFADEFYSDTDADPLMTGKWAPTSVNQGVCVLVKTLTQNDICEDLDSYSSTRPVEGEAGPSQPKEPETIKKPKTLSSIMELVNSRIKTSLSESNQSFSPNKVVPIIEREWPPRNYWEEAFCEELVWEALDAGSDIAKLLRKKSATVRKKLLRAVDSILKGLEEDQEKLGEDQEKSEMRPKEKKVSFAEEVEVLEIENNEDILDEGDDIGGGEDITVEGQEIFPEEAETGQVVPITKPKKRARRRSRLGMPARRKAKR
jgi:hypothetical protein